MALPSTAFYCVCDSRYFLGAVAMLNSLRLAGHADPVYVLDCGLSASERELLAPHATLVGGPADGPPWLLKTIVPLRHPARVMVLIDTDVIVTRTLTELIDDAAENRVAAFKTGYDRFFSEWSDLLALGPVRRRPYLCSAVVFLGGVAGKGVLQHMHDCQASIPTGDGRTKTPREFFEAAATTPLMLMDQDVLNAVLSSPQVEEERIIALDHRLAPEPPFPGVRLIDESGVRCGYRDGTEPYVLHHLGAKPWIRAVRESPYSRLLVRLLVGPDLSVRVPEARLPMRLRKGAAATASRALARAQAGLRSAAWDPLSYRVGARADAVRSRLGGGRGRRGVDS